MLLATVMGSHLVARKTISLYLVSYAKIVVVWMGLYTAIKVLYFIDVYPRDDSSYVVSTISVLPDQMDQLNLLLLDIKSWMQQRYLFSVKHIFREANKVADYVTKCAWRL